MPGWDGSEASNAGHLAQVAEVGVGGVVATRARRGRVSVQGEPQELARRSRLLRSLKNGQSHIAGDPGRASGFAEDALGGLLGKIAEGLGTRDR